METVNKLLKKQAPKISRKALAAAEGDNGSRRPSAAFVRWISTKDGSRIAVPEEMLASPATSGVFTRGGSSSRLLRGKMVQEVA